jgi:hypothetical protein
VESHILLLLAHVIQDDCAEELHHPDWWLKIQPIHNCDEVLKFAVAVDEHSFPGCIAYDENCNPSPKCRIQFLEYSSNRRYNFLPLYILFK